MRDQFNREIDYMRISVIRDCNFNCIYCQPGENCHKDLVPLTRKEIVDICRQAVKLGITKFKITGGEPLLRPDVTEIVRELKAIIGVEQVTLTTNGFFLKEKLRELTEAGLDGINISIDTLQEERFREMTKVDGLQRVLEAIEESRKLLPTKLNVVLLKGMNEEEWPDFIRFGKEQGVIVRFLEWMPLGGSKTEQTVDNREIIRALKEREPQLQRLEPQLQRLKLQSHRQAFQVALDTGGQDFGNGPAEYYYLPREKVWVGFISAMHNRFCESCNRIRLTATGELKGCLCYTKQASLGEILRDQELTDNQREELIYKKLQKVIYEKPLMHHLEDQEQITEKATMKDIGG